ncbi:MAG: extracellular solute-binding protein, partial [Deltaproteobacteria bacterium]|nr:extracellular solute-binding protein [Deltaproteobacteria bacterium]
FQKKYPEINVVVVSGRGSQLRQKMLSENRAGKVIADVVTTGARTNYQALHANNLIDPIKPVLMLPEVVDESLWFEGKHRYIDPERQYILVYMGNVARTASYNTKLLDPKTIKSYWDFLRPEFKGKILARDIRQGGSGGDAIRFMYHNPQIGPKFIERLFSETDLTITRSNRQGLDWLGVGRYQIGLFFGRVQMARSQGLPLDELDPHLFKEGAPLGIGPGSIALMRNAPHPNAAKVYINWYLSREGQKVVQRVIAQAGSGGDSMRIDIPKEDIPPEYRRKKGAEYMFVATPEYTDMYPIYKIINKALAMKGKMK